MGEDKREIKKLPAEVRSQLRSGIVITDMAQCVVELVLNALDAGATSIAVRVNFSYFKVQVIDNGCGMNLEKLDLIGERFMTSKCHTLNDLCYNLSYFGFRGEALASISEVSGLLVLESRPRDSDVTLCKAFNHGKAHKAVLSKTKRAGHGTTVTVHDFMYNMPVRRQRFQSAIDLEEIKTNIESIALIQPQASISLRNDTNGSIILHTRKCSDTLTAFSLLFGQTLSSTLVSVTWTLSEFKISGYISKEAHHHKNLQFIYVNKRLVLKTKLHKLANSMLANSVLLKTNNTANDMPISNDATVGRWLAFSPPRREKHAVYIFNVECPFHAYDICLDPKKTLIEFCDWDSVLKCLETLIRTFLEKEFSFVLKPEDQECNNDSPGKISLNKDVELRQHGNDDRKSGGLKEKSRKLNYSGSIMRKMLQASRIVRGNTAKRKSNKEKTKVESNDIDQERDKILEVETVEHLNHFTEHSQQYDTKNVFCTSQMQIVSKKNVDIFSRSHVISADKIKKLNIVPDSSSEMPSSNTSFKNVVLGRSSTECYLSGEDSDTCPIVRFKRFVNKRKVLSKRQSSRKYIPPIVKFKGEANQLLDVQFEVEKKKMTVPLKLPNQDALRKILNNSNMLYNYVNDAVIQTEGITVSGYLRPYNKRGHIFSKSSKNVVDIDKKSKMVKSCRKNHIALGLSEDKVGGVSNIICNKNGIAEEASRNTSHFKSKCLDELLKNKKDLVFEISEENFSLKGMKKANFASIVSEEMTNIMNSRIASELSLREQEYADKQVHCKIPDAHNGIVQNFCTSSDFLQTFNAGISKERTAISLSDISVRKRKYARDMLPSSRNHKRVKVQRIETYCEDNNIVGCQQNGNSQIQLETNSFKFSPKVIKLDKPNFDDLFGNPTNVSVGFESSENLLYETVESDKNNIICYGTKRSKLEHYQRENMILSSGSEADIELSGKSEPEIRKKKKNKQELFDNRCTIHKLSTAVSNMKVNQSSGSCSDETLERRLCRNNMHLSGWLDLQSEEKSRNNSHNGFQNSEETNRDFVDIRPSCDSNLPNTVIPNSDNSLSDTDNLESSSVSLSQDSVISNSVSEISDLIFTRTRNRCNELADDSLNMNVRNHSAPIEERKYCRSGQQRDFTSSPELINCFDNVKLSSTAGKQMDNLQSMTGDIVAKLSHKNVVEDVDSYNHNENVHQEKIAASEPMYSEQSLSQDSSPISSGSSNKYGMLMENYINNQTDSNVKENQTSCNIDNGSVYPLMDNAQNLPLICQDESASRNTGSEITSVEVLESKSDHDRNDSPTVNLNESNKEVFENDGISDILPTCKVSEEVAQFSCESFNLKERSVKCGNETELKKKSCSSHSSERNVCESEMFTSKSISTQELNDVFERVMNIIPSETDHVGEKQEEQTNSNKSHIKLSEDWEQRLDSNGKTFFIHKQSGMTSFLAPNYSVPLNKYSMKERFGFLPKGLSPILKEGLMKNIDEGKPSLSPNKCEELKNAIDNANADDLATVKWKDEELNKAGCRDLVKEMVEESDTKMQFCEKEVANAGVQDLPKNIVKVYNIMYPCSFKKDIFSNIKLLGQLDNKFIVTVVNMSSGLKQDLIVLFDQHAVHERIRLENLLKEYCLEGNEAEFKSSEISPHINLKLSDKDCRIILSFQKEFERLGLLFQLLDDNELEITAVPTCLLARELREVQGRGTSILKEYLENMIREQVESILDTRGVGIKMPAVLQSVISYEACRGALKFGDSLLPDECEVLLKNLSECQVPFQCAHGRPALVPIVDLKYLQSQQSQMQRKPQLWKLRKQTKD